MKRETLLFLGGLALTTSSAIAGGGIPVKAKVDHITFSGKHYLGFTDIEPSEGDSTSQFETRRNYFQAKAYFSENPKSYMRFTYDTDQNDEGEWNVRLKYAYLYLDNVLPHTGVEFGQAHRPWIDYEEHHGWLFRSISKVLVESSEGAHLTNSADLGINFKTKTPYFSSEIGVFNGEGYHGQEDGQGKSFEWRLTANIFGTGDKKVHPTDRYLNISFFGQLNQSYAKSYDNENNTTHDLNWYGIHFVYNQPAFLISAQYVTADNEDYQYQGSGVSVNGEVRFGDRYQYGVFARYDSWDADEKKVVKVDKDGDKDTVIAGLFYKYNKNVKFIANATDVSYDKADNKDFTKYMVTAEVSW